MEHLLLHLEKFTFPLTVPGIGAGSLLVFILAIGYYITPALVGGASGSLISNTIAYHMKSSLDWAFASASRSNVTRWCISYLLDL